MTQLSSIHAVITLYARYSKTNFILEFQILFVQVYFDLGLCPDIYKSDRRLGDKTILCDEPAALGRITLGLYGNLVPGE